MRRIQVNPNFFVRLDTAQAIEMLTNYIAAALRKARYEILADGEGYFGAVEGLQGIWAEGKNLEACREELREVLEEWIVLGLRMGHPLPDIDGVNLVSQEVA